MKQNKTLKLMVFMAMYAALAIVLDYVKRFIPFTAIWANGGSIDISLIPLAFASFHLGWKYGLITALIEFVVSIAIGATQLWFAGVHPVLGFLCDYIFPIVVMGLCSIFMKKNDKSFQPNLIRIELGIAIMMCLRIFSQILSGTYCWFGDNAAGSAAAWAYSISYNVSYGLPTLVMLLFVMPLLYKAFEKQIKKSID